MKFRENPFAFILDKMNDIENNGDSYTDDDKLYALCKLQNEHLTYKSFLQGKHELIRMGYLAVEGTVMILKNNAKHHCYNGDIGALHFDEDVWGKHYAEVQLPDGRYPCFAYSEARDYLTLAYACTVHKAQGGQAETVIIYMGEKGKRLRKRNLLYTAISRATTQVIIVGNRAAVDDALKNQPESRKSMLVAKTNQVRRGWNRTA